MGAAPVATPAEPLDIAADLRRRFVAAGEPADRAAAAAELWDAYYRQLSQRFAGRLGTAAEIYRRDAPEIRGEVRRPAPEPVPIAPAAEPGAPAPATTAAPVQAEGAVAAESAAEPAAQAPVGAAKSVPESAPVELAAAPRTRVRTIEDIQREERVGPKKAAEIQFEELASLPSARQISPEEAAARRAGVAAKRAAFRAALAPVALPETAARAEPEPETAPLIPTEERPALPPVTAAPHSPGEIASLDPAEIGVDAKRFQFKGGGDEAGVTERLEGVRKWDPRLAGTALVWRDEDGKFWIADGHQRLGLAKRLAASGQPGIRLNAFVLDAAHGVTDVAARGIAAAKNIAEGTGTSIDAAKAIRAAEEAGVELPELPPRSTLAREGKAIARLSPEAFGMAVNEVVPTAQAALVGRLVADPLAQVEAMRVLEKVAPDNLRQAEMVVRDVLATGLERMTHQGGLFGDEAFASSAVLERAKVADQAMRMLRRDKATFSTLVAETDRIESHGANALDLEANKSRLSGDEQATQFLTQLATRKGPVSDALTAIARRVKGGEITVADGAKSFLGVVRRAVAEGLDAGADAGGAELGAAGEREAVPELAQEAAPAVNLFGEPAAERPATAPEPTITEDERQIGMPGMERSAVQAQAARDQAGRGALSADVPQRAADEGLFAKPEEPEGTLFQRSNGPDRGKIRLGVPRRIITLFADRDASTLIHETGHAWLDDLMKYSKQPLAPDALRTDAATVRRWLGSADDGRITVAQHEKFARGFERYMMEGVAPTRALGRVFAQFRDWLTAIYRSVTRLRAPITPEIRDVFDRMLTDEPQRAVVAPEVPEPVTRVAPAMPKVPDAAAVAADLANIHEADVAETAPEAADEAADQIKSETNDTAAIHAPESSRELGTDPGTEGRGGGTPAGGSEADSGLRFPGGAGSAPSGEIGGGRVGAPAGSRGTREDAEALGADPELIEKAANIRLDNLKTPEDVNALLKSLAEEQSDYWTARRGVVHDADVGALADTIGADPAALAANISRLRALSVEDDIPLAARIRALRIALTKAAADDRAAMRAAAEGGDAQALAYLETGRRLRLIMETATGVTAEMGRGLRAFHALGEPGADIAGLASDAAAREGETPFELKQRAQLGLQLDSVDAVLRYDREIAEARGETPVQAGAVKVAGVARRGLDMLLELFTNALISGVATHTRIVISNSLYALWKAGVDVPAAAGVSRIMRALGVNGANEGVMLRESEGALWGLLQGSKDGVRAAGRAVKSGVTEPLPGEEGLPDFALRDTNTGAIPGAVGQVIRTPYRVAGGIHSFSRVAGYTQSIYQQAYEVAAKEGRAGDDFAARVAEVIAHPSEEMKATARGIADKQALMGRGGMATQKISNFLNALPVVRFIVPFAKISSNMAGETFVEHTPLGLFWKEQRDISLGKLGAHARDMQIAQMATGTAAILSGIALAAEGAITGQQPSDPQGLRAWHAMRKQQYSVRIGDMFYSYAGMGPVSNLLALGAGMHAAAAYAKDDQIGHLASAMFASAMYQQLNQSFLLGLSRTIEAVQDPDRHGERWLQDFASSFVPFSSALRQTARATDPYMREAHTVLQQIQDNTPFLSESLYPMRDIWGQPIPNGGALGGAGISAIYESQEVHDPVDIGLRAIGAFPAEPGHTIYGVRLNDAEYDYYSMMSGILAKEQLDRAFAIPGFTEHPVGIQRAVVRLMVSRARLAARAATVRRFGEILHRAVALKRSLLSMPPVPNH